ncbi:MAG: hypothetical protein NZM43_12375 [Saprospiraceae bacterium]|nr:hypothetical protein [Saprospiraceae bacterium]MDW8485108.1 hypothetical protein [Saprospiraceae bacterium]
MKHVAVSLACVAITASSLFAQAASKTFSKSFNAEGLSKLRFELPGKVDLKVWSQPNIRVEINVSLPAGSESTLEQLAKVGRYDLKSEIKADQMTISAPNLQRSVKVKGEELREIVHYVVFIPKDLEAEIGSPSTTTGMVIVGKKP